VSRDPIALWTVIIIAAVIGLLVVLVAIGERRWRAAGMDLDGKGVEENKTMNTGGGSLCCYRSVSSGGRPFGLMPLLGHRRTRQ
jgi:hypothetical protein